MGVSAASATGPRESARAADSELACAVRNLARRVSKAGVLNRPTTAQQSALTLDWRWGSLATARARRFLLSQQVALAADRGLSTIRPEGVRRRQGVPKGAAVLLSVVGTPHAVGLDPRPLAALGDRPLRKLQRPTRSPRRPPGGALRRQAEREIHQRPRRPWRRRDVHFPELRSILRCPAGWRREVGVPAWPALRRNTIVFEPMRPVPPITTVFMFPFRSTMSPMNCAHGARRRAGAPLFCIRRLHSCLSVLVLWQGGKDRRSWRRHVASTQARDWSGCG